MKFAPKEIKFAPKEIEFAPKINTMCSFTYSLILSMFAKCPCRCLQTDCIMPLKKKKEKTGQLSFSCRRLSQVVADYHRYQNITSGKMQLKHRHCNA